MSKANTLSLGVEAVTVRDSELDCGLRSLVVLNLAYETAALYETESPDKFRYFSATSMRTPSGSDM